jgi:hypothetical protein
MGYNHRLVSRALVASKTLRRTYGSFPHRITPGTTDRSNKTSKPLYTPDPIYLRRPSEDKHFQISPEVKDALISGKPIVALETTIYTHGFPYPDNVALALDLESIVRRNGGVPATIGILDGVARIGMTTEELRRITAAALDKASMKVSRRDLPYILGLVSCDPFPTFTCKEMRSLLPPVIYRTTLLKVCRAWLVVSSMEEPQSLAPCFLLIGRASKFLGLEGLVEYIAVAKTPWIYQLTLLNLDEPLLL